MNDQTSTAWVDGLTIDQVLCKTAGEFADQRAIVFDQPNWQRSWSEFEFEVDRAAKGLLAIGIKPCDHVAVWATNVPQWVILQFATARIGAVLVALNPACRVHELAFTLKQSDASALFLIDRFKTTSYIDLFRQSLPGYRSGRFRSIVLRRISQTSANRFASRRRAGVGNELGPDA